MKGFNMKNKGFSKLRGFTLVELMITIMVVAVGVALAIPTYEDVTQRRQTTGQAEALASFLAYAQSEAIKSNSVMAVRLNHTDANNWCVGVVESNVPCDCKTAPNACLVDGAQTVFASDNASFGKSSMASFASDVNTVANDRYLIDPIRGIKDTAFLATHGFVLESDNGNWQLQVMVGPTGRIQVCNNNSGKKVPGFDSCPTVAVPPPIVPVTPPPVVPPGGPLLPPPVVVVVPPPGK